LLQLVREGQDVTVQRLDVDAHGQGEWIIPAPADEEEVTLVISALAPVTTQRASYSLWVEELEERAEPVGQ
jgi:hypothetical protein